MKFLLLFPWDFFKYCSRDSFKSTSYDFNRDSVKDFMRNPLFQQFLLEFLLKFLWEDILFISIFFRILGISLVFSVMNFFNSSSKWFFRFFFLKSSLQILQEFSQKFSPGFFQEIFEKIFEWSQANVYCPYKLKKNIWTKAYGGRGRGLWDDQIWSYVVYG